MSNLIPPRPRTVGTAVDGKRHFPIVASQFNSTYVQGLIDHATAELRTLIPGATTSLLQVPGAFEIPLVVREIALQKRGDVIIAIVSFDDETQARERCLENEINRGTEAARAAVEISNVISKLRNK